MLPLLTTLNKEIGLWKINFTWYLCQRRLLTPNFVRLNNKIKKIKINKVKKRKIFLINSQKFGFQIYNLLFYFCFHFRREKYKNKKYDLYFYPFFIILGKTKYICFHFFLNIKIKKKVSNLV